MPQNPTWLDPLRIDAPIAVAHSILDAGALAHIVQTHWNIEPGTGTQLLQHGQNDWYRLQTANNWYAIRVLKQGSRSAAQLHDELAWVSALAAQRVPVCAALATRDGRIGIEVTAAEGSRLVCLYPWLDGATLDKNLTAADAQAAGLLLARIHTAVVPPPLARRHSLRDKLHATSGTLDGALQLDDERRIVALARKTAAAALDAESQLPQGSLHGDLHFGNLRRLTDGRLIALDFDDCGNGAWCADLTAFFWRRQSEALDPQLDAAFLHGYQQLRPLTRAEQQALPGLLTARALYLAGVLARDRNLLGSVPGFDKPWSHYLKIVSDFATQSLVQTR